MAVLPVLLAYSPLTELSVGIDAATTTIVLVNSSAAPDLEVGEISYLVLATGGRFDSEEVDDYETCRITAKDSVTGNLTVERGVEGTAKQWPIGTYVRCGLGTAKGWNDLVDKVNTQKHILINEETGTTYTLTLSDDGKLIDCNNAGAFTLTVPLNETVEFPVGTQILVRQKGAGQVTIEGDSTVVLQSAGSAASTVNQYSVARLIKVDTDTWALFGDIEEVI